MTSSSEPRRSRRRRLQRWLATTGVAALAVIALGAGTAGAYCDPYDDSDDAQIVSVDDDRSPSGGAYVVLKRSW